MSQTSNVLRLGAPWWRFILAVLVPAIAASFIGSLILALTAMSDVITPPREPDPYDSFVITLPDLLMIGTVLGSVYGQIAMFGLFLPAHAWMMQNTTRRAWMYAAAGVISGLIFGGIFGWMVLFGRNIPSLYDFTWLMTASAAGGVIAGLLFWFIRRPDRDASSSTLPPTPQPQ